MSKSGGSINVRLLTKVSSLYYDQGLNQREIAKRLQLSRPKVSRLLKQAREQNIVQILVVPPNGNFIDLENEIEKKYGLQEVLITESEPEMSDQLIKKKIGSSSAEYLHRGIKEGEVIGVTWGTTLQTMLDEMQPKSENNVHVVQALGGVGPAEAKAHAADISRRLSQLLDAQLTLLPAPGIVGSKQVKKILQNDRQVKNALNLFSKIDTLYVGIGSLTTNPVLSKEQREITEEEYREVMSSNAVGDISLRFFDIDGEEVNTRLDDLIIGISIEEIKQVDTVVGIAGGLGKVDAIRGALNRKLIDVLITDYITATNILN